MPTYLVETILRPGVMYEVDQAEYERLRDGNWLVGDPDRITPEVLDQELAAVVDDPQSETRAAVQAIVAVGGVPDADADSKGVIQLAGDLGGSATAPTVPGLAGKQDAATLDDDTAALVDGPGATTDALRAIFGSPDDVGFDLVLLLGQSNMSGRGTPYDSRTDPVDARVFQYGASGTYASVISQAVEPLAMHDTPSGIGPGLAFARWYAASTPTNRRVLLVPAAHGGTPLVSTATLGWRRGVAGNLYAQALAQTEAALIAAGTGARIVAALWLQGETDGDNGTSGAAYQADLDALIEGLRTDLDLPDLPFIVGQMVPDYLGVGTRYDINLVHLATPDRVTRTAVALGPSGQSNGDNNHYNATAQRILGRRFFDAYRTVINGTAIAPTPGPEPDPEPVVLDTFTRADSGSLGTADTGQSWTALAGAWGVASNQAAAPASPVNAIAVLDSGVSDGTVKVTFAAVSETTSVHSRLVFRSDATGANHWMVQYRPTVGWQLYKQVSGAYSQVGASISSPGIGNGDVVEVLLNGASLTVKLNGANLLTATDAHNQAATYHGIGAHGVGGQRFDDFTVIP